jgi:hypothetical protein
MKKQRRSKEEAKNRSFFIAWTEFKYLAGWKNEGDAEIKKLQSMPNDKMGERMLYNISTVLFQFDNQQHIFTQRNTNSKQAKLKYYKEREREREVLYQR